MNTVLVKYSKEDLISRVPGLFPYLDYDDFGTCIIHKSNDSDCGCYGKIVPAIRIPVGVSLSVDGVDLLVENTVYSYRTLANNYYKYKYLTDNTFINFFKNGIGLFDINNVQDDWDLVPEFEYYANAGRLYEEYSRLKTACENYLLMKPISGENCNMECLVEKYRRMGGDEMMEFYRIKNDESLEKSEYYFNLGVMDETFICLNLSITVNEDNIGVRTSYEEDWVPGLEYTPGNIVMYEGRAYVCETTTSGLWDNNIEEYVFDVNSFTPITGNPSIIEISGESDSRLKSFRCGSYTSIDGLRDVPSEDEDWLWYYKVGTISGYETDTDENGNINLESGTRATTIGSTQKNLLAYGNILTDISVDKVNRQITFIYVIGGNLKAKLINIEPVDPTNPNSDYKYYYDSFEYNDEDTLHGVVYTETYKYEEGGELDIFITQNEPLFDYFIGKSNIGDDSDLAVYNNDMGTSYQYARCSFDVSENISHATTVINGNEYEYGYINSSYTVEARSDYDRVELPTFTQDSMFGVAFNPLIENNIYIQRGNAAAWERHIKLGEVKSFDDIENFANNGFFNIR